jgi:hypothetical protein
MSELTFKSAGVGIREIDNSVAGTYSPEGVPACVIGTAKQGPAFVPKTIGSIQDFEKIFGPVDETQFGAIAVQQWLKNASSATFVRVLGVGDGSAAANYSGFMVGDELPDPAADGALGVNPYAYGTGDADPGRTYVLGAFMTDNTGSTYLADAGVLTGTSYASESDDGASVTISVPDSAGTGLIAITAGDVFKIEDVSGYEHTLTAVAAAPGAGEFVTDATPSTAWGNLKIAIEALLVGGTGAVAFDNVAVGTTTITIEHAEIDSSSGSVSPDNADGNNKKVSFTLEAAKQFDQSTLSGATDKAKPAVTVDITDGSAAYVIDHGDRFIIEDSAGAVHKFIAQSNDIHSYTAASGAPTVGELPSDIDITWTTFEVAVANLDTTADGEFDSIDDGTGAADATIAVIDSDTAWGNLETAIEAASVDGGALDVTYTTGASATLAIEMPTESSAGNEASVLFGIQSHMGEAATADNTSLWISDEFEGGADDKENSAVISVASSVGAAYEITAGDTIVFIDLDTDGGGADTEVTTTLTAVAESATATADQFNISDTSNNVSWNNFAAKFTAHADTTTLYKCTYNLSAYTLTFEALDAYPGVPTAVPDSTIDITLAAKCDISESFAGGEAHGTAPTPVPIVRGMLMTPSGVLATVNCAGASATPADTAVTAQELIDAGSTNGIFGHYNETSRTFNIILNGFDSDVDSDTYTVSLDPSNSSYIANVLNTDPLKLQEKGHLLYSHLPVDESQTYPDINTTSHASAETTSETAGSIFLVPGEVGTRGESGSLEDFSGRFNHPVSPWVVSQSYGSVQHQLFRFHHKNDGLLAPEDLIRISVSNLKPSSTGYPTFTVMFQRYDGSIITTFSNLSLDPKASNYIAAMIGDKHEYYNLDKATPQLADIGTYGNINSPIRIEMAEKVSMSLTPQDALPFGHEAYSQLKTGILRDSDYAENPLSDMSLATAVELPVPFRMNILGNDGEAVSDHDWGTQFTKVQDIDDPNKSSVISPIIENMAKYRPAALLTSSATYNNSDFTLERIEVNAYEVDSGTGLITGDVQAIDWSSAQVGYRRDGVLGGGDDAGGDPITRFFSVDDLSNTNQLYAKFSMFMQGGFNGTNIFVEEKSKLMNTAIEWEYEDASKQHAKNGPTASAYRTALDVLSSKSDTDFNLLAMPGIRNVPTTKYAIDMVENRFDAMYIMDIAGYNSAGGRISTLSDDQIPNAGLTASNFEGLSYDSSFAAAYFPDVTMNFNGSDVVVPASCAVLGAFSKNDNIAYSWFAPAGFTRGALSDVSETGISFSRSDLDDLYEAKVNPITSFPGSSIVVWGQKTLLQAPSSLDRVNVRRLLIYIRRRVREIALGFLFEPNRSETLAKFNAAVNPLLESIQANNGVERFKVKIDAETTTQIDVENNTLRGKIYIQPTLTAEFISLDFVVSNTI